jgi:hypothetical protein
MVKLFQTMGTENFYVYTIHALPAGREADLEARELPRSG